MAKLPEASRPIGAAFTVRDPDPVRAFWVDRLGLEVQDGAAGGSPDGFAVAPRRGGFRLGFDVDADAVPRPYPCVGLYHVALLLPDRPALAGILSRLVQEDVAFEGFADHGVSEAAYLRDPERAGVELTADRPRDAWPRDDEGRVAMTTDPLDVEALLAEAEAPGRLDAATRLGHVHLHVPGLDAAERFYGEGMGLDVTQRSYPGALFFSVGGYHHHVACNSWAPRPAPDDAAGLDRVTWSVPGDALGDVAERWDAEGFDPEVGDGWVACTDPAGIDVRLEAGR